MTKILAGSIQFRFVFLWMVVGFLYAQEMDENGYCIPIRDGPCKKNSPRITADFLYWYAEQNGEEYASTGTAITVPGTIDPNTELIAGSIGGAGRIYSPDPTWNPGFRVSFGWSLPNDAWRLCSEYAFLFARAEGDINSGDLNAGIIPLFSYIPNNSVLSSTIAISSMGGDGFISSASSQWSLQFNTISLEVERFFLLSRRLSIAPRLGLLGSWQTEKSRVLYKASSDLSPGVFLGSNRSVFDQTFWGFGPRVRCDCEWFCWRSLSLYGNIGASVLWGAFDANAKAYDTNIDAGYSDVLIANQTNFLYTLNPVVQAAIGVDSNWAIRESSSITIRAGWEAQVWFFQNQQGAAIADSSLILQGLTAGVMLDF